MGPRTTWAEAFIPVLCLTTLTCIACVAEAEYSNDRPAAVRHEANLSAGGVPPAGVALENPHKNDPQSPQAGARLFSAMNCDGCHGGGGLGFIGPSLVDGRWHHGGTDQEVFRSIFYGRPKGMPAYGGLLGSEGAWLLVTYLKSQPVQHVGPTTSYEDLTHKATAHATGPTPAVALRPALSELGVEGMLAKYGCVACHAAEKKSVGPAFKDVAEKYRAQTGAAAYLTAQVKNGGAGVWGVVPMPPHVDVPNTDLDAIIAWILTTK